MSRKRLSDCIALITEAIQIYNINLNKEIILIKHEMTNISSDVAVIKIEISAKKKNIMIVEMNLVKQ